MLITGENVRNIFDEAYRIERRRTGDSQIGLIGEYEDLINEDKRYSQESGRWYSGFGAIDRDLNCFDLLLQLQLLPIEEVRPSIDKYMEERSTQIPLSINEKVNISGPELLLITTILPHLSGEQKEIAHSLCDNVLDHVVKEGFWYDGNKITPSKLDVLPQICYAVYLAKYVSHVAGKEHMERLQNINGLFEDDMWYYSLYIGDDRLKDVDAKFADSCAGLVEVLFKFEAEGPQSAMKHYLNLQKSELYREEVWHDYSSSYEYTPSLRSKLVDILVRAKIVDTKTILAEENSRQQPLAVPQQLKF